MITLTTPPVINTVLGGNVPVTYDKLVIGPFTMDGVTQVVSGAVRLTSTTTPTMQPIIGSLRVSVPAAELVIEVVQIDFFRRIALGSAENTALLAVIEAAQLQIETGLIGIGVIAGVRTAGV